METVRFPYGKGYLTADFEEGRLAGAVRGNAFHVNSPGFKSLTWIK